eukprot:gene4558-14738_t
MLSLLRASRPPVDETDLSPSQSIMNRYHASKYNQAQIDRLAHCDGQVTLLTSGPALPTSGAVAACSSYNAMGARDPQGSQQQQVLPLGLPRRQPPFDITLPTAAGGTRGWTLPVSGSYPSQGPLMSGTSGDVLNGVNPAASVQRISHQQRIAYTPTPNGGRSSPVQLPSFPPQVHPTDVHPRRGAIKQILVETTTYQAGDLTGKAASGLARAPPLPSPPPPNGWQMQRTTQAVAMNTHTTSGTISGHHTGSNNEKLVQSSQATTRWPARLRDTCERRDLSRTDCTNQAPVFLPSPPVLWKKNTSLPEQSAQVKGVSGVDWLRPSQGETSSLWVSTIDCSSHSVPLPLRDDTTMGSAYMAQFNNQGVIRNVQDMIIPDYLPTLPLSERLEKTARDTCHPDLVRGHHQQQQHPRDLVRDHLHHYKQQQQQQQQQHGQYHHSKVESLLYAHGEQMETALSAWDPRVTGPTENLCGGVSSTYGYADNYTLGCGDSSTFLYADNSTLSCGDNSTLGYADSSTFGYADNSTLSCGDNSTLGCGDSSTLGYADNFTLACGEELIPLERSIGEGLFKLDSLLSNSGNLEYACVKSHDQNKARLGDDPDIHGFGAGLASVPEGLMWAGPPSHDHDPATHLRMLDLGTGFKQ